MLRASFTDLTWSPEEVRLCSRVGSTDETRSAGTSRTEGWGRRVGLGSTSRRGDPRALSSAWLERLPYKRFQHPPGFPHRSPESHVGKRVLSGLSRTRVGGAHPPVPHPAGAILTRVSTRLITAPRRVRRTSHRPGIRQHSVVCFVGRPPRQSLNVLRVFACSVDQFSEALEDEFQGIPKFAGQPQALGVRLSVQVNAQVGPKGVERINIAWAKRRWEGIGCDLQLGPRVLFPARPIDFPRGLLVLPLRERPLRR